MKFRLRGGKLDSPVELHHSPAAGDMSVSGLWSNADCSTLTCSPALSHRRLTRALNHGADAGETCIDSIRARRSTGTSLGPPSKLPDHLRGSTSTERGRRDRLLHRPPPSDPFVDPRARDPAAPVLEPAGDGLRRAERTKLLAEASRSAHAGLADRCLPAPPSHKPLHDRCRGDLAARGAGRLCDLMSSGTRH